MVGPVRFELTVFWSQTRRDDQPSPRPGSAKEIAKAWIGPDGPRVPRDFVDFLKSQEEFDGIEITEAVPEQKVPLDDFRGNTRNTDLAVTGKSEKGLVAIGVEAKVDEPFGDLIGEYLDKERPEKSNVPKRIDHLSRSMFGRAVDGEIRGIRYQLLHASAAVLIRAKSIGAAHAVFLVHEFITDKWDEKKARENMEDFQRFVAILANVPEGEIRGGTLYGPVSVPGGEFVPGDVPLFLGKMTTDKR